MQIFLSKKSTLKVTPVKIGKSLAEKPVSKVGIAKKFFQENFRPKKVGIVKKFFPGIFGHEKRTQGIRESLWVRLFLFVLC